MINTTSVSKLSNSLWYKDFKLPLYSGYSFYCLPNIIKSCFGLPIVDTSIAMSSDVLGYYSCSGVKNVALILIDAFGWRFWKYYLDNKYCHAISLETQGVLSCISSCFPSTTSLHVTALSTGQAGGESGIYEWFIYEPRINAAIAPLPFSLAREESNILVNFGLKAEHVFPKKTIYEELLTYGVESSFFQEYSIIDSISSSALGKGAKSVPFSGLRNGLSNLRDVLLKKDKPKYCYLYYDCFDTLCHRYGPQSPDVINEGALILKEIDDFMLSIRSTSVKDETLLLVCADHGHTEVNPNTTIFLNISLPQIVELIEVGYDNKPIAPIGSPRDLFLKIYPCYLEEALTLLKEHLHSIADVYLVTDLINRGFFGPVISSSFVSRVGNLVILPFLGQSVWWYESGVFEMDSVAYHGGLTDDEMSSALLVLNL